MGLAVDARRARRVQPLRLVGSLRTHALLARGDRPDTMPPYLLGAGQHDEPIAMET